MSDDTLPAGCRIRVDRRDDDVIVTVPPLGLWHGNVAATVAHTAGKLLLLAFIPLSCAILGTAALGACWLADAKGARDMWPMFLVFLAMALFGGSLLIAGLSIARRRAVLSVIGGRLTVKQTGFFGGRSFEWFRDEIADIKSAAGRWGVGEKSEKTGMEHYVIQLQIHLRSGAVIALLAGYAPAELEWMASGLRRALRLTPGTSGSAEPNAVGLDR